MAKLAKLQGKILTYEVAQHLFSRWAKSITPIGVNLYGGYYLSYNKYKDEYYLKGVISRCPLNAQQHYVSKDKTEWYTKTLAVISKERTIIFLKGQFRNAIYTAFRVWFKRIKSATLMGYECCTRINGYFVKTYATHGVIVDNLTIHPTYNPVTKTLDRDKSKELHKAIKKAQEIINPRIAFGVHVDISRDKVPIDTANAFGVKRYEQLLYHIHAINNESMDSFYAIVWLYIIMYSNCSIYRMPPKESLLKFTKNNFDKFFKDIPKNVYKALPERFYIEGGIELSEYSKIKGLTYGHYEN